MQKTLVGVLLAVAAGVLSGGAVYVAVSAQLSATQLSSNQLSPGVATATMFSKLS